MILACPALEVGTFLLVFINSDKQRRVPAHQSRSIHLFILVLSAIAITLNGDKVATSSEKGQNIRIFSVETGDMIQEFRRGNEYAMIYSMSFSKGGNWLSCSSDSNIIHIFHCQPCHEEVFIR
jgi:WD40 repeat protein